MTEQTPGYLSLMPPAERKLLQLSIHMNAMIVANADGKYSLRESVAFAEAVRKLITEDQYRPLLRVAGSEPITDAALKVYLEQYSEDVESYLQQLADLVEQLPAEEARAYRKFTLYSIVSVAEASRAGLFGLMGDRISLSEKRVMKRMVEVLRLPLDEATRAKLGVP